MSCGVFSAREGVVLVKFTQGDIKYMPASGAGRGALMIRGGGAFLLKGKVEKEGE